MDLFKRKSKEEGAKKKNDGKHNTIGAMERGAVEHMVRGETKAVPL